MKLFERCINCEHAFVSRNRIETRGHVVCELKDKWIDFPRLMGGSRKCACYKRGERLYTGFDYPEKEDEDE